MTTQEGTRQLAVRNGGVVVPSDPVTLGNILAQSGYFTDSRGAAQAAVKVMAGQELGFGPVASMTGIYIVKGRVTLSANLMAAAIKRHPHYTFRVKEHTSEVCTIDFIEDGEVIGTSSFSMDDAKAAGLAGSETYRKFPKNMLYARALSNGAKWYCPDVFGGGPIYTPDELGAEVDGETGEVVNAQPVEEVVDAEPVAEPVTVDRAKHLAKGAEVAGWDGARLRQEVAAIAGRDLGEIKTQQSAVTAIRALGSLGADQLEQRVETAVGS